MADFTLAWVRLRETLVLDQTFIDQPLRQIVVELLAAGLGPDHGYTIAECGMRPVITARYAGHTLAHCFDELAELAGCTWHVSEDYVLRFVVDERPNQPWLETMALARSILSDAGMSEHDTQEE